MALMQDAVGWLVDYAGPLEPALKAAWDIAAGGKHSPAKRSLESGALKGLPAGNGGLPDSGTPALIAARRAILRCIRDSCGQALPEALLVQARHSADFMGSALCRSGGIGVERQRALS